MHLKTIISLSAVCLVVGGAEAQDVGKLHMTNDGLAPGVYNTGSFDGQGIYYAGEIKWATTSLVSSLNNLQLSTLCSSFNQEFFVGNNFDVEAYKLAGYTVQTSDLPFEDTNSAADPGPDSGYSLTTFNQAASVFQAGFAGIGNDDNKAYALQMAVWHTLYPEWSYTVPANVGVGSIGYDFAQDLTLTTSGPTDRVMWLDYSGAYQGGQGQFALTPVPEPITSVLALAGVGLAVRRMRPKKLSA